MSFEITLPEIETKSSSKDFILAVLIEEWPLSIKEIYNRIKKDYKFKGTYQAVYKSINELFDKKVLTKNQNKYEVNISWIKKLQSFTDVVETNYYATNKTKQFLEKRKKGEDTILINFESIFDAEKYLYYFVKNELKKSKPTKVFYGLNNLWKVLFYYRAEYNYYTKLQKRGHQFHFLTSGNSNIEKEAINFYKKIGIKIKKSKTTTATDTIVLGDYYIQIFIPEVLTVRIEKYLNQKKDFELAKLLDEENHIKVIIHKDKSLAEGISKKSLKDF